MEDMALGESIVQMKKTGRALKQGPGFSALFSGIF
jgi:hypothetical protein